MLNSGNLTPKTFPKFPEDWEWVTEKYSSPHNRIELFATCFKKKTPRSGRALFVVHGLGEHSGRYSHLPNFLSNEVDWVYCLDLRGHGRSQGTRGHIENFDYYLDDCALAFEHLKQMIEESFESEIHLLGHSLGGLISLLLCYKHKNLKFNSMTLTAPLIDESVPIPIYKRYPGYALSKVWGSLQMPTGLDLNKISRDPEVVRSVDEDQLCHRLGTPRFLTEMEKAKKEVLKYSDQEIAPIQFLIPMDDALVDSDASIEFFKSLRQPQKKLVTLPGFYHEPLNDIGKETAFEELANWINQNRNSNS